MTNCPNCAAPLKDGRCEYCGTEVAMIPRGKMSKMSVTSTGIYLECSDVNIFTPNIPQNIPLVPMYRGEIV